MGENLSTRRDTRALVRRIALLLVVGVVSACATEKMLIEVNLGGAIQQVVATKAQAQTMSALAANEPPTGPEIRCKYWRAARDAGQYDTELSGRDRDVIADLAGRAQSFWCAEQKRAAEGAAAEIEQKRIAAEQAGRFAEEEARAQAQSEAVLKVALNQKVDALLTEAEIALRENRLVHARGALDSIQRLKNGGVRREELEADRFPQPGETQQASWHAVRREEPEADPLGEYLHLQLKAEFSPEQQGRFDAASAAFEAQRPKYEKQKATADRAERVRRAAEERAYRKRLAAKEREARRLEAAAEREERGLEAAAERETRRREAQGIASVGETIASFRGEGVTSTDSFSAKGKWRIEWSSSDDLYIFIKDEKTGRAVESAGGTSAGDSIIRKSGTFFLTVTGTEAWAISVTQL